jgi:hypothetical protein
VTREFEALRTEYWPGRLLDWRVEHRSLSSDVVGYCDYYGRRLLLDLDKRAQPLRAAAEDHGPPRVLPRCAPERMARRGFLL